MGRAPCCEKVGLKRGRWTAEEDEILTQYIQAKGEGSWRTLPKNAGLLRCGKSCRLRWINYLREDLKRGNITPEEEETIVKLHSALGNRWSLIAGHLPGRTDNEIKNYWNTHLSRKLYSFTTCTNESLSTISTMADACKRRGGRGRTRRSAMKKHKSTGSNIVETSLPKPLSNTGSELPEPHLPGTTVEHVEKSRTVGIGSWVPEPKVETRMNLGVQDSFLDNPVRKLCHSDDSNSGGLCPHKEIVNSAVELWPIQTRESEELWPVERLDDEIMRIGCIIEGGAGDRSGNAAHKELVRENGVTGSSTERVNGGALGTEKEITTSHEVRETSVLSSNADWGELYTGSSSVYSGFNEWLDWNWVGGVECYNPWALWDEGADKMLTDLFMGSWQR